MTVRQIAEAVGKNPATVARWVEKTSRKMQEVSRKVQEAKASSKPALYTLPECIEIIREGMGDAAADVYAATAAQNQSKLKTKDGLPSGALIREMRLTYGPEGAAHRLDQLLGFTAAAEVVRIAVADKIGRISAKAYAVEMQERAAAKRRQIEAREPGLFDQVHNRTGGATA